MVDRSRLEELRRKHRRGRHRGLAAWAGFPVNAEPRPLVLMGSTVRVGGGFRSREAKLAFLSGAIDSVMPLPVGLLEALSPDGRRRGAMPSVHVVGALRTSAEFNTDRGLISLSAWAVSLREAYGRVYVLDPLVAATAWWPAGLPAHGEDSWQAHLHEDAQTLTVTFDGWAGTDYPRVAVFESDTAVVVEPVAVHRPMPFLDEHNLDGDERVFDHELEVRLGSPLDARVLLGPNGFPIPVVQSGRATTRGDVHA
jgi:hypothetical protein